MNPFSAHTAEIRRLVAIWEPKLLALHADVLTTRFNSQHRTIKMILGHLCDSATNNTHRIVHLQYQPPRPSSSPITPTSATTTAG